MFQYFPRRFLTCMFLQFHLTYSDSNATLKLVSPFCFCTQAFIPQRLCSLLTFYSECHCQTYIFWFSLVLSIWWHKLFLRDSFLRNGALISLYFLYHNSWLISSRLYQNLKIFWSQYLLIVHFIVRICSRDRMLSCLSNAWHLQFKQYFSKTKLQLLGVDFEKSRSKKASVIV